MLLEKSILNYVFDFVAGMTCRSLVLEHLELRYRFGFKLVDELSFLPTQHVELVLV